MGPVWRVSCATHGFWLCFVMLFLTITLWNYTFDIRVPDVQSNTAVQRAWMV